MVNKPTQLERLQTEYNEARRRYRAAIPTGGRRAAYWRRRFSQAAQALEMAGKGRQHTACDLYK